MGKVLHSPRWLVCAFFLNPNTRPVLLLALPTLQRTFSLARTFNELLLRLTNNVHASSHHVYGHAGNTGNECADAAVSLGREKLSVSENNVPIFWPEEVFQFNAFFEVLHCLTQIAERLHTSREFGVSIAVRMCQLFFSAPSSAAPVPQCPKTWYGV